MNTYEVKNRLMNIFTQLKSSFNIRFNNLEIVISSRLRSSNGTCAYHYNKWTKEVEFCKIKMSQALLEEFGWERFEKTFRHEVAHLANAERGGKGHDRSFKNLCSLMGGSMNPSMAGIRFSHCADTGYVKPIAKWVYICPCGYEKTMAKRMKANKMGNSGYRCGRCRTYTLDTWTEKQLA